MEQLKIFSGSANVGLANAIAKYLGTKVSNAKVEKFPDGETKVQITTNVRGMDTFVIQPTGPPVNDNIMELLIMLDALKRASAQRVTAVIPYYGYGKQDRKLASRSPVTAKLVADLITIAGTHRVLTLDLHSGQIQGYFNMPVDSLKSDPVLLNYLREKKSILDKLVIIAPDADNTKRAKRIAQRLNAKMALIDSRDGEDMYIVGDLEENAVIVKDMIDTVDMMIHYTNAIIEQGAKNVYFCVTHAIFTDDKLEKLNDSHIKEVIITDSTEINQEEIKNRCPDRKSVV